jgi:hypothetical protein
MTSSRVAQRFVAKCQSLHESQPAKQCLGLTPKALANFSPGLSAKRNPGYFRAFRLAINPERVFFDTQLIYRVTISLCRKMG